MATVRLRVRPNGIVADLPRVCINCGAPTTLTITRQYVGFLPGQNRGIAVPVCAKHQIERLGPSLLIVIGGLLFLTVLPGISLLLYAKLPIDNKALLELTLWGVNILCWPCWFAGIVTTTFFRVRVTEYTETHVTMTNVSPLFVDAVEEAEDVFYQASERRRRDAQGSHEDGTDVRYTD